MKYRNFGAGILKLMTTVLSSLALASWTNVATSLPNLILLAWRPASVIVNRYWEEGLSSSLRFGLASLPPACDAVLVLLGDQVAVNTDDLGRLAAAWRGEESLIAASVYDQHVGVPAIFPRLCFSELAELRGDHGARTVLERNNYRLVRVPMANAAIDLDTPEDLAVLTERFKTPPQE